MKAAIKTQLTVKFPAKSKGCHTRVLNRLAENKETIRKLESENVKLGRKYSSLLRKWQRRNKTFSNSPMSRAKRDLDLMKKD